MKNQQGFVNGWLMVGIALIALIAGAVALATRGDGRDVTAEKRKAASTVVIKRVVDLIERHQIQVANGDAKLGQGFLTSVADDMSFWPKEAFAAGNNGQAVNEGTVTYITGIDEEFCRFINETLQVSGIPSPEAAPNDRVSCVVEPAPAAD